MEPPLVGGKKVCSKGHGHMTKVAAMPIYGKSLKNLLLQNQKADNLETWYAASGDRMLPIIFTLTYFTARSDLLSYAFIWEKR